MSNGAATAPKLTCKTIRCSAFTLNKLVQAVIVILVLTRLSYKKLTVSSLQKVPDIDESAHIAINLTDARVKKQTINQPMKPRGNRRRKMNRGVPRLEKGSGGATCW
jgi:hypothetical protein